jgi:hypothetical protein
MTDLNQNTQAFWNLYCGGHVLRSMLFWLFLSKFDLMPGIVRN